MENTAPKEIILKSNPKSPYSILSGIVFLLLLSASAAILLHYQSRLALAIGLSIVPLALAVFMMKLLLWNIGGIETITIHKSKTTVELKYPFIFPALHHEENSSLKAVFFRSNIQLELLKPQEIISAQLSNSLYKLHLEFADGKSYQSSISFELPQAKDIINLVRS